MAIPLEQGQTVRRVELHDQLGGRRQGGISPSKVTPNVLIFTDPERGLLHGYVYDGWREDGLYHYTGEGQVGDQVMTQGNRTIRDHKDENRELHLFDVNSGQATYIGEFEYVDHYQADAPETDDGPLRKVYVFRLRPLDRRPGPTRSRVDQLGSNPVQEVPVEQHLTETMVISPGAEPRVAERREQRIVRALEAHLAAQEHEVCRLQFRPPNEPAPLFCDLYDKTTATLYEAKGTVSRPAFRMAIGQLADYSRLVEGDPKKTIFLPEEPRPDLLALAEAEGIAVSWPEREGFEVPHA
jgi:hypothetical protein